MKSIKHLSVENDVLKSQIASPSDEVIKVVNSKKSPKPVTTDQSERSISPSLLIGRSSVWDIDCMDPSSLLVKSRGRAKTGDVLKSLKEIHIDSYGDVIIHVCTNDCATKCPTDKILNNFCDISVHAKCVSRTGTVKFSSITPCVDNPVAAARGVEVNDGIRQIAEVCKCIFVCHRDNFLCRNGGDINEELLSVDGLYLSKLSNERLISNLKLSSSESCRIGRSQRPGGDPQRPKPWTMTPASRMQAPGADQPRRHQDRAPASHPSSVNDCHATTGARGYFQRNHGPTERGPQTNFCKKNSTYSNYCQFCGEGNHRHHVCRFGMPVVCYRCHKGGHKENSVTFIINKILAKKRDIYN